MVDVLADSSNATCTSLVAELEDCGNPTLEELFLVFEGQETEENCEESIPDSLCSIVLADTVQDLCQCPEASDIAIVDEFARLARCFINEANNGSLSSCFEEDQNGVPLEVAYCAASGPALSFPEFFGCDQYFKDSLTNMTDLSFEELESFCALAELEVLDSALAALCELRTGEALIRLCAAGIVAENQTPSAEETCDDVEVTSSIDAFIRCFTVFGLQGIIFIGIVAVLLLFIITIVGFTVKRRRKSRKNRRRNKELYTAQMYTESRFDKDPPRLKKKKSRTKHGIRSSVLSNGSGTQSFIGTVNGESQIGIGSATQSLFRSFSQNPMYSSNSKKHLIQFLAATDPCLLDIQGYVNDLFSKYEIPEIARQIKERYDKLPPGWESDTDTIEADRQSFASSVRSSKAPPPGLKPLTKVKKLLRAGSDSGSRLPSLNGRGADSRSVAYSAVPSL